MTNKYFNKMRVKVICKLVVQISLLFALSYSAQSQKTFTLTIDIPKDVNSNNFNFLFDNGKSGYTKIKSTLIDNHIQISDTFYSKFATVVFIYNDKEKENSYFTTGLWIGEKPASITFKRKNQNLNQLEVIKSQGVSFLEENPDEIKMNLFTVNEDKDLENFTKTNPDWEDKDSLNSLYNLKLESLLKKRLEFIKLNSHSYYSLWFFKTKIITKANYNTDSLIHIFHAFFPDSFKTSVEGEVILTFLNGKALQSTKLSVDFTATDINNNKVSLHDFTNKSVLLVFWASWCGPCIEEFPQLKRIQNKYSKEKLEIIAVSTDDNYDSFLKAVKKYDLKWTHIFGNTSIKQMYGVNGIPDLFLIDKAGKIIFSNREENTNSLAKLERVLDEMN